MARLAEALDRLVGRVVEAGKWLALPVVLLLSAQWPLRDLVRCCSREANDVGQWLFALFIAIALTAATRAGTHLRADFLAQELPRRTQRRIAAAGAAFVALPWSCFTLALYGRDAWRSLLILESFPDTNNPGYFIIKLAVVLMAALVAAQALADMFRAPGDDGEAA
ncbi:MAG TPA: TRAP transporter small permease subunit [Rhodoblastus sp.]|nr:TRAP transporter small permease subunit [Rhodoblastus sp.]